MPAGQPNKGNVDPAPEKPSPKGVEDENRVNDKKQ